MTCKRRSYFFSLFSGALLLTTAFAPTVWAAEEEPAAAQAEGQVTNDESAAATDSSAAAEADKEQTKKQRRLSGRDVRAGLNPVQRGFYMGLQGGLSIFPMRLAPGESTLSYRYAPGGTFGLNLGYDINNLISLQLQTYFGAYHGLNSEDQSGKREDVLVNDLTTLGLRLAILFTVWHNTNIYMQVGAGFGATWLDDAMVIPYPYSLTADVLYSFEYYTKLRHFSIGVDVDLAFLFTPFNMNIQILPHLRYTF